MKTFFRQLMSLLLVLSVLSLSGCQNDSAGKDPAKTQLSFSPGSPIVRTPASPGRENVEAGPLTLDFSNKDQGYFTAVLSGDTKVSIQVTGPDQILYKYFLSGEGNTAVFPFTAGSGPYIILAYENVFDEQYTSILTHSLSVKLKDDFLPFLYPNQYVDFTADSRCIALAGELSKDSESDRDALNSIYQYVTASITYDEEKANSVEAGYLPDVDETLATGKGICFDYAALTVAMLRSLSIPARLNIGYSGSIKHAWVDVYIESMGWVKNAIEFNGSEWKLMDPTYSAALDEDMAAAYIGDGDNYITEYVR